MVLYKSSIKKEVITMADKQVIIDGINVSGCIYFNSTDEHYCDECSSEFGCAICDEQNNCYYKQLQRVKQELAKAKQELAKIKEV